MRSSTHLLCSFLLKAPEGDEEEQQEVNTSLAAAKEVSMSAAEGVVLIRAVWRFPLSKQH